jgi:anti-sigma-K factor RskA
VNIKEYIESGIIEQFVMGETNEQQTREVMDLAKKYPEIQAEIKAVEIALIDLAEDNGLQPQERTKGELFNKLFSTETPVISMQSSPQSGSNSGSRDTSTRSISSNKRYLVAASVALIVSLGSNLFFYQKWKTSEDTMIAMSKENQQFASIMALQKESYAELQNQMEQMNSMDMVQVKLTGSKMMPEAKAMVYYNTKSSEVYLHVNHLPSAPENKQYQLWAIVDGKPVDAGVFDSGEIKKMMLKMKNSSRPIAFAVTIEKKGGSVNPTLEQMVMIGNLSS